MHETEAPDTATFESLRGLLFAIAYRMLGSAMDAEDIVQEAFLEWRRHGDRQIDSPKAFLSTVVVRRSINLLKSARVQREVYPGPWLPEPVAGERGADVANGPLIRESISMAFLVLLEQLTPMERAVFLLHDVFAYDFGEIAAIVGASAVNCRQIGYRARLRIRARRPRFDGDSEHRRRLTEQFIAACTSGDLGSLIDTLAHDVTLWGDGGGKAPFSAPVPIVGAERVAAFILGVLARVPGRVRARPLEVNGQPGFILGTDEMLGGILALDIVGARIQGIRFVANPEKLRAFLDGRPGTTRLS